MAIPTHLNPGNLLEIGTVCPGSTVAISAIDLGFTAVYRMAEADGNFRLVGNRRKDLYSFVYSLVDPVQHKNYPYPGNYQACEQADQKGKKGFAVFVHGRSIMTVGTIQRIVEQQSGVSESDAGMKSCFREG